jgi:hypothetical protein
MILNGFSAQARSDNAAVTVVRVDSCCSGLSTDKEHDLLRAFDRVRRVPPAAERYDVSACSFSPLGFDRRIGQ